MIDKHKLAVVMSGISGRINKLRVSQNEATGINHNERAAALLVIIKHLEEVLAELQELLKERSDD